MVFLTITIYILALLSVCRFSFSDTHCQITNKTADASLMPGVSSSGPYELPDYIETEFIVEGMRESLTLSLFDDPAFSFYTYYPEDMFKEKSISDDRKSVTFLAGFGGIINPSVYLTITMRHKGVFSSTACFLHYLVEETGIRSLEWKGRVITIDTIECQIDVKMKEYIFRDDEIVVTLYAGEYEEQYFWIKKHYPIEYGDGFHPRADLIIAHFTWKDF